MTYTDTQVDLIINKLSKEQYESKKTAGTLNANELYITDDDMTVPTKVSDLVNDSGFQNATQVASAIAAQDTITMSGTFDDDTEFSFEIVGKASE